MAGWYHWFDGHEFEQTLGFGDGQGSLVFCSPRVAKSQTRLSNWTECKNAHKHIRLFSNKIKIQAEFIHGS